MASIIELRNARLVNSLKKDYPDAITDNILLIFSTDLSLDGEKETGYCAMYNDCIKIYSKKDIVSLELTSIEEFKFNSGFSSISFECITKDGETIILCRSTMAKSREVSILAKQMNRYITGRDINIQNNRDIESVCPKCGRPYTNRQKICENCTDIKGNIFRLVKVAAKEKWKIILATIMTLATAGINLLIPKLNSIMVDDYIKSSEEVTLISFILIVVLLAVADLVARLIGLIKSLSTTYAGINIVKRLRKMVFDKIETLSFGRVSRKQTGELMERINSDTGIIQNQLTGLIPELVYQLLIIVSVSVIIFRFDWKLGLLIFMPIPFVILSFRAFWSFTRKNHHRQWVKSSKASTILHDIFNGIRVVKSYGTEESEAERYDESVKSLTNIKIKNDVFFSILGPSLNFFISIGEFFLLYYAANKILGGEMTLGTMMMFSSYISLIYGRLRWFSNIPRRLVHFATSTSKVFELLDEEIDVKDPESFDQDFEIKGNITLKNVNFGYEESAEVLKNINLEIKSGEMIGLVGKSGCGKTTLINLIMRLYDVDDGSIMIDGKDIREIPKKQLHKELGVVLQENYLFNGTIRDNIAYAKPDATEAEIINAAKVSGAHSFINKLPDGYDTYIGEHGQNLSGGEKQRLSIARAMLHNPKILILDEATSALDTETEKNIQDALQKLIKNRTTIAIAHRLSTLRNATKIVVIDKGTIAEVGSHEELLRKKGIYYNLVMAQRQMSKFQTNGVKNA